MVVARRVLSPLLVTLALAGCSGSEDPEPQAPLLTTDATSLQFASLTGTSPEPQIIALSNDGGGSLAEPTAEVSYLQGAGGWLSATVSGLQVTLTVDSSALAVDHYAATVRIASAGSANGAVEIPVALDVLAPRLVVTPDSLTFTTEVNGTMAPQTFTITEASGGALALPTAAENGYFTVTIDGEAAPYTVTVSPGGTFTALARTTATDVAVFSDTAPGGHLHVPITLNVLPPPPDPASVTYSCYTGGGYCRTLTSTCGPKLSTFAAECAGVGGIAACPTENLVGVCLYTYAPFADRYGHRYYGPQYASTVPTCDGGVWYPQ